MFLKPGGIFLLIFLLMCCQTPDSDSNGDNGDQVNPNYDTDVLNIEWIYKKSPEPESEVLPVAFPPKEDLTALIEFAEKGLITEIQDYTARLRQTDRRFHSFADKVDQLAENFQFDQMIVWLRAKTTGIEYKQG